MENMKQYASFIKRIVTAPLPIRIRLLKSSNLQIIKAISELVYNIIQKNIKVPQSAITKLKKHKKILYKLIGAKNGAARKQILLQNPKCFEAISTIL